MSAQTGTPDTFLRLRDTPDTYAGQTGKAITVKTTEDGLEFNTITPGTGTVTSFSAGDLPPLFTTTETNPTTTPALAFALSNAAAHTFLGNETGSTAAPHYVQPNFTDLAGDLALTQTPSLAADKLVGRGNGSGAGDWEPITLGTNLSMSGGTLNAASSGGTPAPDPGYFQYNNAGAFGAVQLPSGAGAYFDGTSLDISGDVTPSLFLTYPWMYASVITGDYVGGIKLSGVTTGVSDDLYIQSTTPNFRSIMLFAPNGTVANFPSILEVFGSDIIADPVNYGVLQIISAGSGDTYHLIDSYAAGTGTRKPIQIEANATFGAGPQLVIGTDGGVSVGTGTQAGDNNLLVAGTINGSNLSGTNTGDQSLAGLVPTSRTLTINGDAKDLSADRSWTVTADAAPNDKVYATDLTLGATTSLVLSDYIRMDGGADLIIPSDSNVFIHAPSQTPPVSPATLTVLSNFTTSLVGVYQDIPGLIFPTVASGRYWVQIFLQGFSTDINGVIFTMVVSASAGSGFQLEGATTGRNVLLESGNGAGSDSGTYWAQVATVHFIKGDASVATTASEGFCKLQVKKVTASTATINAGSRIIVTPLN